MTEQQFYWHVHHHTLCEPLTEPVENRIAHINMQKAAEEIETRLRLMKPVRGELPKAIRKAGKAYYEARKVYYKTEKALDKARTALDKAWKARDEALRAFEEAEKTQEMITLHKAECPNCPWNGETIFP